MKNKILVFSLYIISLFMILITINVIYIKYDKEILVSKNIVLLTNKSIDLINDLNFENTLFSRVNDRLHGFVEYKIIDNELFIVTKYGITLLSLNNNEKIKSIKAVCGCTNCYELFYLTENNNVYYISIEEYIKNIEHKESEIYIDATLNYSNIKSISVFKTLIGKDYICEKEDLVYKDLENNIFSLSYNQKSDTIEKVNPLSKNNNIIYIYNEDTPGIHIISEKSIDLKDEKNTYIKDNDGKILKANYMFYGNLNNEDIIGKYLFVINEKNNIYYIESSKIFEDQELEVYNNKKVKSINETSSEDVYKVKIEYTDGSSEEIYTPYSYNEEYKF